MRRAGRRRRFLAFLDQDAHFLQRLLHAQVDRLVVSLDLPSLIGHFCEVAKVGGVRELGRRKLGLRLFFAMFLQIQAKTGVLLEHQGRFLGGR